MSISTYINIEHQPLLYGIFESVHSMKLAQELFILESLIEGSDDDIHA